MLRASNFSDIARIARPGKVPEEPSKTTSSGSFVPPPRKPSSAEDAAEAQTRRRSSSSSGGRAVERRGGVVEKGVPSSGSKGAIHGNGWAEVAALTPQALLGAFDRLQSGVDIGKAWRDFAGPTAGGGAPPPRVARKHAIQQDSITSVLQSRTGTPQREQRRQERTSSVSSSGSSDRRSRRPVEQQPTTSRPPEPVTSAPAPASQQAAELAVAGEQEEAAIAASSAEAARTMSDDGLGAQRQDKEPPMTPHRMETEVSGEEATEDRGPETGEEEVTVAPGLEEAPATPSTPARETAAPPAVATSPVGGGGSVRARANSYAGRPTGEPQSDEGSRAAPELRRLSLGAGGGDGQVISVAAAEAKAAVAAAGGFRDYRELWGKRAAAGFAGKQSDLKSRLSRNEAEAALQRLANNTHAQNLDEVRQMRKLVDEFRGSS